MLCLCSLGTGSCFEFMGWPLSHSEVFFLLGWVFSLLAFSWFRLQRHSSSLCSGSLFPPSSQLPGRRGSVAGSPAATVLCSVWQQSAVCGFILWVVEHLFHLCCCSIGLWAASNAEQILHQKKQERRKGKGARGWAAAVPSSVVVLGMKSAPLSLSYFYLERTACFSLW